MSEVRAHIHITDKDMIRVCQKVTDGDLLMTLGVQVVAYLSRAQAALLCDQIDAALATPAEPVGQVHDITKARRAREARPFSPTDGSAA